jgi:hypothetical protein
MLKMPYRFDVAGAGACLKRYTDPSFFRTEWASSELMKAERAQRDKRARREKVRNLCCYNKTVSVTDELS